MPGATDLCYIKTRASAQRQQWGKICPKIGMKKKFFFLEYLRKTVNEQELMDHQIINVDKVLLTFDCPSNRTVDK